MFFFKKKNNDKLKMQKEKFFQNINQPEQIDSSSKKQKKSQNSNDHNISNRLLKQLLSREPKKEGIFISSSDQPYVDIFARQLQNKLYNITFLSKVINKQFEDLYKMVYYYSHNYKIPKWARYYDLLFISEAHAIIISKYNFNVGPLLTINEIMNSNMNLLYLKRLLLRLEIIINYMIKIYNEGKNYNYYLKDSIKELKLLGLISSSLYEKLFFIADIRMKANKASNIQQIKILDYNNEVERLVNIETEFKFLVSELYVELISIYVQIQEPYLQKFYYLWKNKALNINKFNTFYYI